MIVTGARDRALIGIHSQERCVATSKMGCANGKVTTLNWSSPENTIAPSSHGFENSPNSGMV